MVTGARVADEKCGIFGSTGRDDSAVRHHQVQKVKMHGGRSTKGRLVRPVA